MFFSGSMVIMKFPKIIHSLSTIPVLLLLIVVSISAQQVTDASRKKDGKKKSEAASLIEPAPVTPFSEVRRDTLLNGLPIVSLAKSGEAKMRCDLVIRSGAMFDLAGKTGLAKLTQETLLAANPQLIEELESLGATMQWGVSSDLTWYRLEAPAKSFSTALEIIGRLLIVENIRSDAFKAAQAAHLKKIKAAASSPAERADTTFLATLYGVHPYGHSIDGTEKSVMAILLPDVQDYYRKFYLANNAVVVLTGDVRHEGAVSIFKAFLGSWVKGVIVPMTFRQPERVTTLRLEKVEAPELSTVELRGGVTGVKLTDQDFIASQLLGRVLEARLKKEVSHLSAEQIVAHAPQRLLAAPFYFSASVSADRAPEFSRKATEVFTGLVTTAVSAEELSAAQSGAVSEFSARSTEDHLREIESYNLPRNYALTYSDRVRALTAVDLQRVARRMLEANALTVIVMGKVSEQFKSQL
jgi:zinc protease